MKIFSLKTLEWVIRINIFLKLLNYGIGKLLGGQFYRPGEIPSEIASIALEKTSSFNLAWTFFGHSQGYIFFIGISQLLGATLFLIERTKLLGGLMLTPILLNIIVVDLFFGVAYGAMFSACFYLAGILWVLFLNRVQVEKSLRRLLYVSPGSKIKIGKVGKAIWLVSILAGVGIVFLIEWYFIALFGYTDR